MLKYTYPDIYYCVNCGQPVDMEKASNKMWERELCTECIKNEVCKEAVPQEESV